MLTIKGPIKYPPKNAPSVEAVLVATAVSDREILLQERDRLMDRLRALENQLIGIDRTIEILSAD